MRLTNKNILIVDDDDSLRLLVRKVLEGAGCVVDEARSVREALEKTQAKFPDLIVLDLSMPEHDGFVFLKFRAQNRLMHSVPVLVLSGAHHRKIMEQALAVGANQFLEKPLRASALLQKLRYLFYSQEHYSYTFPSGTGPVLDAELNGLVIGHADDQLRISCSAKFEKGKPVHLRIDDFLKHDGFALVGKLDNRLVELEDGLFRQTVTITGLDPAKRTKLNDWRGRV